MPRIPVSGAPDAALNKVNRDSVGAPPSVEEHLELRRVEAAIRVLELMPPLGPARSLKASDTDPTAQLFYEARGTVLEAFKRWGQDGPVSK